MKRVTCKNNVVHGVERMLCMVAVLLVVGLPSRALGAAGAGLLGISFSKEEPTPGQPRRTLTARLFDAAPQMDDLLADPCWRQAARTEHFLDCATGKAPRLRTAAYVGHRDDVLYVKVVCEEPDAGMAATPRYRKGGRDQPLWDDHSIELHFDTLHDHRNYDAIIVNSAGLVADFRQREKRDMTWGADLHAVAHIGQSTWSVAVAIPKRAFEDFQNGIWGFNIIRHRPDRPTREGRAGAGASHDCAWNPPVGQARGAAACGHLAFEQHACYIRAASLRTLRKGANELVLTVINRARVELDAKVVLGVTRRGRTRASKSFYKIALPPAEGRLLSLPFTVKAAGWNTLSVALLDSNDESLLGGITRRDIFAVEPVSLVQPPKGVAGVSVRLGLGLKEMADMRLIATMRKRGSGFTMDRVEAKEIPSHTATVIVADDKLQLGEYELRVTLRRRGRSVGTARCFLNKTRVRKAKGQKAEG